MRSNLKILAISLILLCCLMGAASAAEDVSTDIVSDSIDDAVTVDAVPEDTTIEEINEDIKTDENIEESVVGDSEPDRASSVTATTWAELESACNQASPQTIYLSGAISSTSQIKFNNSATIIGDSNSYITGGSSNRIAFVSDGDKSITFKNVIFKNMDASVLIKLATVTGTNTFINCSFDNIHTYDYKSSVIWNDKGYMNISGCNFTNCQNGFGAVTNYATSGSVQMNVENSRFINNSARREPGAINNCGEMNVTNCTFIHNIAAWWAGAIHTHTNAHTIIVDSTFDDNLAGGTSGSGWNGGALFSYSTLEVYNSTFTGNNCSVLTGGGAIFGYSMGTSIYNITVDSCNFTHNANNYNGGRAGAIGVQNIGYLTVTNSNFVNNVASIGQAIYAMTKDEPYCINCTNCSCPNCPNCTNCSHNVSTGEPNTTLINNNYLNHIGSGDTVVIDGERYIFNYNVFIDSTQNKQYRGTGNDYGDDDGSDLSHFQVSKKSILGSSILGDWEYHDVIYVNKSSPNDSTSDDIHGSSWEDAYGKAQGLYQAMEYINNNGIIYVAEGNYKKWAYGSKVNCTIIGMNRENTIFENKSFTGYDGSADLVNYGKEETGVITFVNITFKNPSVLLRGNKVFINCTFINAPITTDQDIYECFYLGDPSTYTIYWSDRTYNFNFTNCDFINYTTEGAVLQAFATSQVNFNECTFENVTAKSIVNNTGDFICEDSINFKDCVFNNVNVKGIVDVPEGATLGVLYTIEGCTGVESYGVVTEDGRDFVNSTKSAVDTALTGVVDVDSASAVITLTDIDGNAVVGATISYSINGADAINGTTNETGQIVITGLSGNGTIAINYEGNDSFNPNSTTLEFNIPEPQNNDTNDTNGTTPTNTTKAATKLAATKVTATYNVAKKLVITLTANGKALANKKVTVKVGTISKTLKTNAKGQVSLNVATLVPKTYTATVKFAGDSSYAASTVKPKVVVKKAKVKLAAKAKTFKVKVKTKKYIVTLKNNKGKVMKKVKLTLKVGKKTYKATTNSKGKATFKITKLTKKGKYTATVKFAGNKYFNALSKKVKITVKK